MKAALQSSYDLFILVAMTAICSVFESDEDASVAKAALLLGEDVSAEDFLPKVSESIHRKWEGGFFEKFQIGYLVFDLMNRRDELREAWMAVETVVEFMEAAAPVNIAPLART